jgi:L-iditol 2-dehydrogenase
VLVIGAGAIGLLHLLALRAFGVERVLVVGRGAARLEHARRLGATAVVADGAENAREAVLELTRGQGADVVVECTGQPSVWEAAPDLVGRGGWLNLFGGCAAGTRVSFDAHRLHYDQIRVVSPFHFTPRAVRRAHDLLVGGQVQGSSLISGEYDLARLAEALERHRRGDGIKYAVVPSP